jgi:hypothetical protein
LASHDQVSGRRDHYTTLQEDFGYEFTKDNFASNETFTKFIDSPQFKQWLHE